MTDELTPVEKALTYTELQDANEFIEDIEKEGLFGMVNRWGNLLAGAFILTIAIYFYVVIQMPNKVKFLTALQIERLISNLEVKLYFVALSGVACLFNGVLQWHSKHRNIIWGQLFRSNLRLGKFYQEEE